MLPQALSFGGDAVAKQSLLDLGKELGFGSLEEGEFQYCGKRIKQDVQTGTITVSMEEYHSNLHPIKVLTERKKDVHSSLNAGELKQLRALLGSLQWLVAQVRLDMGYHLSVLQGEKPCIGTMLRANALLKRFKDNPGFSLKFKPLNLADVGVMVLTDSSLGNVRANGSPGEEPLERLYSQSCYFVLLAEKSLMEGKRGGFAVVDARSHRLPRVCRSTYAAELLGTEEGFDVGQFVRGHIAAIMGYPLLSRNVDASTDSIGLTVVTDAKDVYDKGSSDTPSYGSQKSLAFTVAWIRGMLQRANTSLRWTSAENMFVDAGTKDMDLDHMHRILDECEWCAKYTSSFIKQTNKGNKMRSAETSPEPSIVGEPVSPEDALLPHLTTLSECTGWHERSGYGVHVARKARSFRTPSPRFEAKDFPHRTTFARLDFKNGHCEWRKLEDRENYMDLQNPQALFGTTAAILVAFFHPKGRHESTKGEDGL